MERVLVLGGATGLLGQAIVQNIQRHTDWQVDTLGRSDGNIFDPSFISKIIKEKNPTLIFNTVAWTQVDAAEEHAKETHKVNAGFPETLAHILKNLNCHLVHISTDFVFSGAEGQKMREEDKPKPQSVYGATKLQGEEILLKLIPNKVTICRTAWLFGPHRKNFVEVICKAGKERGQLKVVADQIGSPTYTRDLANWCRRLAEEHMCGIWHTVNSGRASWYDLAVYALKAANINCDVTPITSAEWPQKAHRPAYSVLDTTKLAKFLGTAIRPWEEAVDLYSKELSL